MEGTAISSFNITASAFVAASKIAPPSKTKTAPGENVLVYNSFPRDISPLSDMIFSPDIFFPGDLSGRTCALYHPTDRIEKMTDDQLADFGMTNLKILKNLGIIPQERIDRMLTAAKESFRKENDSLPFSQLMKKEKMDRLLDYYSSDELKAKFDAEFKDKTVSAIMLEVGPQIFTNSAGRKIVDYSRFETLGTVKLHEIFPMDGKEETYRFEKNRFGYESNGSIDPVARAKRIEVYWS